MFLLRCARPASGLKGSNSPLPLRSFSLVSMQTSNSHLKRIDLIPLDPESFAYRCMKRITCENCSLTQEFNVHRGKKKDTHKSMKRRQQDLIMEFIQLILCLHALIDQWGGLHSLNGMKRREYNHQLHKRILIPPLWKMAEKWRTQMEKWIAPL